MTQDDIDDLQADADQLAQESKQLKSELAKLRSDKTQAINLRLMLDRQIDLTKRKIVNTESRISGYNALLDQTAYELEENRKKEAEQYELFCDRARVMEMQGTPSYWAVLFKATSFSDLLSRLADVQTVIDYDQQVIDELREIRVQIQEKQDEQERLRTETEAAKTELEAQKADLDRQRREADEIYQQIAADEALAKEALDAKNAEAEKIQAEIVRQDRGAGRPDGLGRHLRRLHLAGDQEQADHLPLRPPEHGTEGSLHQPQGGGYRRRGL